MKKTTGAGGQAHVTKSPTHPKPPDDKSTLPRPDFVRKAVMGVTSLPLPLPPAKSAQKAAPPTPHEAKKAVPPPPPKRATTSVYRIDPATRHNTNEQQVLKDKLDAGQRNCPPGLIERFKKLENLLTSDQFDLNAYSLEADYDLAFEETFDVRGIHPGQYIDDKEFIDKLKEKYPVAFERLNNANAWQEADLRGKGARFADNNIAGLLVFAKEQNCPQVVQLLKECLKYCIVYNCRL